MERHLGTEVHWEAWITLLRQFPGHERELDTRATAIFEGHPTAEDGDPVLTAITAAGIAHARITAIDVPQTAATGEVVPLFRRAVRIGGVLAAAAVVLVAVLIAEPGVRYRGGEAADLGTVELWGAAEPVRLVVGQGIRPVVEVGGEIRVQWDGGPGRAYAWYGAPGDLQWLGPDGFEDTPTELVGSIRFTPTESGSLVLVRIHAGGPRPATVQEEVVTGRAVPAGPLGPVVVQVLDLVVAR